MKKLLLVTLFLLIYTSTANAGQRLPLHVGSSGPKVCNLKWLLSGHKPNVFTAIKGTFKGDVNCSHKGVGYFGPRTKRALLAYKYRLGYPKIYVNGKANQYFFDLLKGKKRRHITWVILAAKRVKAIVPGSTPLALRIKNAEVGQLGVTEYPFGSNCGTTVKSYQRVTGAYCAAWCVSFQQWSFLVGGYGTFADRSAGVYYVVDWASHRGYLRAKAKVGALVAFIQYYRSGYRIPGTGHIGFVTKVTASGFSYISGNSSNSVNQRYYNFGARPYVFIYLPGVA